MAVVAGLGIGRCQGSHLGLPLVGCYQTVPPLLLLLLLKSLLGRRVPRWDQSLGTGSFLLLLLLQVGSGILAVESTGLLLGFDRTLALGFLAGNLGSPLLASVFPSCQPCETLMQTFWATLAEGSAPFQAAQGEVEAEVFQPLGFGTEKIHFDQ